MKTIGTVTFVRNAEKYIIPHLKMYDGLKNYVCYLNQKPENWYIYPDEPDGSKELIEKHFPDIETFSLDGTDYNGDLINRARERVKEDMMLFLHADVIFSETDFKKLVDFIQNNDYDLYRLDMSKCMIDYYHDFDHGVRDCVDKDPIAISKDTRFSSRYWTDINSHKIYMIDWEGFTAHHFNGWKGIFTKKEWIENRIPTEAGTFMKHLEEHFGGWLKCPEEIKNKFL